jgi:hypothetical protein
MRRPGVLIGAAVLIVVGHFGTCSARTDRDPDERVSPSVTEDPACLGADGADFESSIEFLVQQWVTDMKVPQAHCDNGRWTWSDQGRSIVTGPQTVNGIRTKMERSGWTAVVQTEVGGTWSGPCMKSLTCEIVVSTEPDPNETGSIVTASANGVRAAVR